VLQHEGMVAAGFEDVRPAHYAVLRHLRPEGSRVTELAEEARMTKQSMGELVVYLERRGYVERLPDPLRWGLRPALQARLCRQGINLPRIVGDATVSGKERAPARLRERQLRGRRNSRLPRWYLGAWLYAYPIT
jgi:hypothetical protein